MKKIICCLLLLMMVFCSIDAVAAGKLSVTKENFYVINGYSTYAYVFAKVENVGNKTIDVNAGILEIYDEKGDVITSSDSLYKYAKTLQPGEYTYVQSYSKIEVADNVGYPDDYLLTITGKTSDSSWTKRFPVESRLSLNEYYSKYSTKNYMYATVTNDTDETVYGLAVVFALLDADNNVLYVEREGLSSSIGVAPGSKVVMKVDVPNSFMDYYNANNIVPTTVDAIAYINN